MRWHIHRWIAGPIDQKIDGRRLTWTETCSKCPATRHCSSWDEYA